MEFHPEFLGLFWMNDPETTQGSLDEEFNYIYDLSSTYNF